MVAHQETIPLPSVLWVAGSVELMSGLALRWLLHQVAIGGSLKDMLGSLVAGSALSYTVTIASLWALFT